MQSLKRGTLLLQVMARQLPAVHHLLHAARQPRVLLPQGRATLLQSRLHKVSGFVHFLHGQNYVKNLFQMSH